jgi:hypothetical protein
MRTIGALLPLREPGTYGVQPPTQSRRQGGEAALLRHSRLAIEVIPAAGSHRSCKRSWMRYTNIVKVFLYETVSDCLLYSCVHIRSDKISCSGRPLLLNIFRLTLP